MSIWFWIDFFLLVNGGLMLNCRKICFLGLLVYCVFNCVYWFSRDCVVCLVLFGCGFQGVSWCNVLVICLMFVVLIYIIFIFSEVSWLICCLVLFLCQVIIRLGFSVIMCFRFIFCQVEICLIFCVCGG